MNNVKSAQSQLELEKPQESFDPRISTSLADAPGATMRQEIYRVAFDEAHAELSEILGKFEQLRLRKERIEKLVEALKPLVSGSNFHASDSKPASAERQALPADHPIAVAASDPVPVAVTSIHYPSPEVSEPPSDPFSRRESSASRDLKEYSRLFTATK
jgi:hypothetical protein